MIGKIIYEIILAYSRIPKHLVRDNANMIIVFKQEEMNVRHVYNDHVLRDMTLTQFLKICGECWKDKYGFLVVSKDDPIDKGRYDKGFNTFILL